jgi:hypothetical protein
VPRGGCVAGRQAAAGPPEGAEGEAGRAKPSRGRRQKGDRRGTTVGCGAASCTGRAGRDRGASAHAGRPGATRNRPLRIYFSFRGRPRGPLGGRFPGRFSWCSARPPPARPGAGCGRTLLPRFASIDYAVTGILARRPLPSICYNDLGAPQLPPGPAHAAARGRSPVWRPDRGQTRRAGPEAVGSCKSGMASLEEAFIALLPEEKRRGHRKV